MRKRLLIVLGGVIAASPTFGEKASSGSQDETIAVTLAQAAKDFDAKSACLSLDPLPSGPSFVRDADILRALERADRGAAAIRGERWSKKRTRSALRSARKSMQMRPANEGCDATMYIEAPRAAGGRIAVRVAILYKGAGARERGYLLALSGGRYTLLATTAERLVVS